MSNAVIYARYSSTMQTEQSIEGQLRDCYKLAKELNLTVINEYVDRALSGTSDNRPQFRKMISDSALGAFDTIITWKMDRFARNRTDSALYKKLLKDNGVKVIYAAENIPEGNEGVILESVLEGLAEYYSLDLAQKTIRGKKESIRKGRHVGGTVLYGYKLDPNKYYLIDETVAPIIRKIFNDYVSGIKATDIAKSLNRAGIRTKAGAEWTRIKIGQVLNNKKYTGVYEGYEVKAEVQIPQIIDERTFNAAQKMLSSNKKAGGRNKSKYKYLLSGKIKCGKCGGSMCGNYASVNKKTNEIRCYYSCNAKKENKGCDAKSIQRDLVESLVLKHTMQIILQEDFINKIADKIIQLNSQQDESIAFVKSLEVEKEEIKKKIDNIMEAIEDGIASKRMKERLADLEKREEQIEEQLGLEKLKNSNKALDREQIIYWLSVFKDGDIQSEEFCEKLIKFFINKVVVFPDKIEIYYNYVDTANKQMLLLDSDINNSDTESLEDKRLSISQSIRVGKYTLCLEIKRNID